MNEMNDDDHYIHSVCAAPRWFVGLRPTGNKKARWLFQQAFLLACK
jgi:hypothetical protein